MSPSELRDIIAVCRDNGVSSISVHGVSIRFYRDHAQPTTISATPKTPPQVVLTEDALEAARTRLADVTAQAELVRTEQALEVEEVEDEMLLVTDPVEYERRQNERTART